MEEYNARKAAEDKARKAIWRKRLDAYRKRLEEEKKEQEEK